MRALVLVLLASLALACSEPGQTDIARGNVLASQKKFDEAIEAYRAAAQAAPKKARPRELLGHVLLDQKRQQEARAAYEEALQIDPKGAIEARIGLSRLDAEEGKLDSAIDRLGGLIEQQPGNVFARLSRANLAMRRSGPNDAELAVQDTAEAMRVDAKNPSVLYTRGSAFIAAKSFDQAQATFELLAKEHPRSPFAWYGLARLAAARQQRDQVLDHLREALARSKDNPGMLPAEEVRKDPAFAALKDDPEFLKVIEGA